MCFLFKGNLILAASWTKADALSLWDTRNCTKKYLTLPILVDNNVEHDSSNYEIQKKSKRGEYLYACKFFQPNEHRHDTFDRKLDNFKDSEQNFASSKAKNINTNYSTVVACGSGTQSLHLIDYKEGDEEHQHLGSLKFHSPLYCLDIVYSYSLITCGAVNGFYASKAVCS
jgi:hypothetical protein